MPTPSVNSAIRQAASYINHRYSLQVSIDTILAFNAHDLSRRVVFYSFYWKDMGYLLLLVMAAAFVSACLPLLTNLRRNPIRDMRDE
jgi:hypothetical protein